MLDREIITHIGPYRVMITHGHAYSVNYDMERLTAAAKAREVDIVMFGHTHIPAKEKTDGVFYLNPGSVSIPKEGSWHGYMILEDGTFLWKDLDGAVKMEHKSTP